MASFPQQQFSLDYNTGIAEVRAKVNFGSATATLDTDEFASVGITSFARTGTGAYTVIFDAPFKFYRGGGVDFIVSSTTVPAAPLYKTISYTASTRTLLIMLFDAETPAATDPADGEIGNFRFTMKLGEGA